MTQTRNNLLILWREHLTEQDVYDSTQADVVAEKEKQQTRKNVNFVSYDFHDCWILKYSLYRKKIFIFCHHLVRMC